MSALLALGALGGAGEALADSHRMDSGHTAVSARQVALRQDMRALWEEHITWTRMAIGRLCGGGAQPRGHGGPAAAQPGGHRQRDRAQARWVRNADQIADFLSGANPTAWPRAEMRWMMREHLTLTTDEAVARLTGEWRADIRAFDRVHVQALGMADMLSAGIISQFPRRFR